MVRRFFWALTARFTRATVRTPHSPTGPCPGRSCSCRPARGRAGRDRHRLERRASAAEQLLDPLFVGLVDLDGAGQPAGTRGRLDLQLVALAGLLGDNLAAAGDPDPLAHPGVA